MKPVKPFKTLGDLLYAIVAYDTERALWVNGQRVTAVRTSVDEITPGYPGEIRLTLTFDSPAIPRSTPAKGRGRVKTMCPASVPRQS